MHVESCPALPPHRQSRRRRGAEETRTESWPVCQKVPLIPGNTVYAPDRCLLVPQRINMLFMSHRPNKFGLPEGIRPAKLNKYEAFYQGKYIGTFSTLQEAFDAHAERKEKAIKDIAIEYHDILPNEVFLAVTNYHVTRWDEHK